MTLNARLAEIAARLGGQEQPGKEAEAALRFELATLLTQAGRRDEALQEHLKAAELNPASADNLDALGLLLLAMGKRQTALAAFAQAVKHAPESPFIRVNYGGALLEEKDAAAARLQFEAALCIDPMFSNAHAGLYYALSSLGEREAAERHRRIGFGQKNVIVRSYKGSGQPVKLLLLVASGGGNTPIEKLLDDTVFETSVVVADFYDANKPLPPHNLVVNGVGDADVAEDALRAAERLLKQTSTRAINSPQAVLETSRCRNAERLREMPGMVTPRTRMFAYAALSGSAGAETLEESGFRFPLLLRAPGFHMGEHFVKVDSPGALANAVASLPGAGRPDAQLLAIEYLDARGPDGFSRKYRAMTVDGRLYPLHLAAAPQWKIHYFSGDMAENAGHRAEEARFLDDMPGVLGARAMAALEGLQAKLGLDYGGVDFALGRDGEVLLFEANATMVAEQPDSRAIWDYRRPAIDRIHAAVRQMLLARAGAQTTCQPMA